MLRVRLLGGVTLEVDGEPVETPASRRAVSVLAWLALNRGPHPRTEVAGRFWPELPESSARSNLRLAIWAIRRALGPAADSYLLATREEVGLAGNGAVWVDLLEVHRLVKEGRSEEALALCRGDPLPELDDEWVYEPREEHRERVLEALGSLAAEAEERGDFAAAIAWTRRQIALDPLAEEVARELMRRLAVSGDRGAALAAYERLRERLERELGIGPSRPTRELAYALGAGGEQQPEAGPVRQVVTRSPTPESAALPGALARAERGALVGRRRELQHLRAELERAWAGELRVVLIGGEAGIGKSRLASEVAREATSRGARVLFGHSDEESIVPFQPFVEGLGRWVRAAPVDELRDVVTAADAGDLSRLLPEIEGRLPAPPRRQAEPDAERYRMFEAVTFLLARLAARAPLLLVLEDLHWAGRPTLLLLKHIVRMTDAASLLVLATLRESEPSASGELSDLLADLRRDSCVTRLSLGGLAETEVAELVASMSAPEPPPLMVRVLHRDTGGNPFFLVETLRHLAQSGLLPVEDGHWRSDLWLEDLGVAEGVKEVVGRRLKLLDAHCRRLLDLGAVIGRSFKAELLGRLSDNRADVIAERLEEAVLGRILNEEGDPAGSRYSFSHALIRQTLYEALPRSRRIRLHRAIVDTLEDLHSDDVEPYLGDLAYHVLRCARPRDADRALTYARRAAAQAMQTLAYEEAAGHLRRALEALALNADGSESTRCELLLELGGALRRSGESEEAGATFEAAAASARQLGRADLLARAALGFAGTWAVTRVGLEPRSVAMLEEAAAALGSSDPLLRARVLTRLSEELYYSEARERRAQLSDEALRLVRHRGEPAALAMALGARHTAVWGQVPPEERLELAQQMSRLGGEAHDPEIAFQGAAWRFADLLELGRAEEADAALGELVGLGEKLRQPAYRWWAHMLLATRAGMIGEFDEADAENAQAQFWGRRARVPAATMYAGGQRHYLRQAQGRLDDVVDSTRLLARQYPAVPSLRCMAAEACAAAGLEDEARAELRAIVQDQAAIRMMNASWSIGMYSLAMASARLAETDIAGRLYDALIEHEPYCHVAFRAASFAGSVARTLGVLAAAAGRRVQAESHLATAAEVNGRIGALPQLALTRHELGQLLRDVGRRDEAAKILASAQELAQQLGIRGL